jgi:SOS-response transcriptional repressor LexA
MTPAQQKTYNFLKVFFEEHQRFPNHREIMKRFNLKSPTPAQERLKGLKEKGLVDWIPRRPGTLRLTEYRAKLEKIEA